MPCRPLLVISIELQSEDKPIIISSLHCAIDTRYWYRLNLIEKTQCLQQYGATTERKKHQWRQLLYKGELECQTL